MRSGAVPGRQSARSIGELVEFVRARCASLSESARGVRGFADLEAIDALDATTRRAWIVGDVPPNPTSALRAPRRFKTSKHWFRELSSGSGSRFGSLL